MTIGGHLALLWPAARPVDGHIPCEHEVVAKSEELDDVNGIDGRHLMYRSGYLHMRCLLSVR